MSKYIHNEMVKKVSEDNVNGWNRGTDARKRNERAYRIIFI